VAGDTQPAKRIQDFPAAALVKLTATNVSADGVGDLGVDQMGNMNVLVRGKRY
jgi:hypothetical protein